MSADPHDALYGDFLAVLLEWDDTSSPEVSPMQIAGRLVHLVVLHGLLPELESPPAGAPRFDERPQDRDDGDREPEAFPHASYRTRS